MNVTHKSRTKTESAPATAPLKNFGYCNVRRMRGNSSEDVFLNWHLTQSQKQSQATLV
jgi:hypothetical protein